MKKRLTLNENLFEGIISHRGRNKLSKYLKEDDNLSIQDKFNYLKSYPTYNSRSGSGKAYTRPCKVYDLGLTDEQREEFFKFLEDGGLEAFWNAHEYDSLNIYQEGRMGGHLILDPQIVDPYVFDEFDSYEEYLQDYLDSNYYPDLETAEGDLEYSSEQIENATSEVNSEISGAYDALIDFDNRVDALIRDLKGTLDLRINDPDVDNLDEDQTLNEKKSKQITADDIYQALEKVGYHNIYANSKGNGYYISKRFEKNLQKAKDILDQYGIEYDIKPSRDRFYLNMEFSPEQLAESAEARDLEETDEIDEIIAQLKDDGYELDNDQDILQGLGADLGYDKEEQLKLLKAIKSRLSAKSLKEEFNQSEIDFIFSSKDEKYPYMILSRLKSDCDYYLGAGNKADKHLWALNPKDQIAYMRAIYDRLEEKPEWLTSEQIDEYEKKMIDNSLTESTSDVSDLLDKAYNGSYYTIIGAGGNLDEWKNGYQELLNKEGIGTIKEWITFNGADMNNKYQLKGDNAYPADLTFLAFPLDGLNIGKLAMFKLRMEDRWFDDIVDNNKSFNESYSSRLQKLSLNETFKVVDKNGKKVPQGGGFTSKKEAEMFAAQYGEKDLKVVSESFEDEHLGEVSKKEFTVTAADEKGSTYLGRVKAKDNKEAEDKFAKEKGYKYKILGSHETTPDEIRKGVRLIEDMEMIPETPQTDSAMGIAGVINNLIIDEFEAIDGYNSAIITAEKEGITDIVDVLKDIVNEENIHVGQLQTCLTKVSPNAQSIDDGQVEAQQQLDNINQTQATQEVTEAFDKKQAWLKEMAQDDWDAGHTFDPDDFHEFKKIAKECGFNVNKKDFDKYFEYLEDIRYKANNEEY